MGKSVNQIVRILIIILFCFAAESGIAQVADFAGKVGELRNSHNYKDLRKTGITSKLISESHYQNIRFKSSLLKEKSVYQKSIESGPEIGEEKDFFVRDILTQNTWNTTTAVLSYSEAGINIWVQKTAYDTLLGTTLWTEIQQRFDEFLYHSTPSHSVLPEVGVLEIIDRYVGKFPDVDNDQTLDVLLLDIQDNFEGTGSFVAGFFDPVNLYEFEFSNRRDLIYLDLYPTIFFDGEIYVERAVSTFAHESQHLIHAGYEGEEAELVFVNEGFSEAVEILCGFEPRSEKEFQRHPLRKLTGWDHENPIPDYSRASLWMHYLIEQLGVESLKYFIQNPTTGINGYREVIESISTFTFEGMFQNWGMALTLNDTGQNSKYGYQHELRKHRILYPQIVFNNLPTIFNEKLSGFINLPVSFSLTKELQFDTGLPSMSNTRVSSISTYPGIDEKEIQVNSYSFLTVNADKWKFGDVEVLLSSYEDADSSYSRVLSFMGDGEKSGQDLRWRHGEGSPEKFYMNASYLMLNDDESLGIIFPPNESEYWLKDIKLWTLFKSELEGTGVEGDEKRAFRLGIYTFSNGKPGTEIVPPVVFEVKRELGRLVEENFDLSGFYDELSAIKDTLIIIFENDRDDKNDIALGMNKGGGNATFFQGGGNTGWVSLSEKNIDGNSLENWNPALEVRAIIPEAEQQYVSAITDITYNFEGVRVNVEPTTNYDSVTVYISAKLPDGSFRAGELLSQKEHEFTFSFPVLVEGDYKFVSSYKSLDGRTTYRDEKEWNISVPHGFELSNNYPNPFNPTTTIPFLLLEEADISWEVFDVMGRRVLEIPSKLYISGEHYQKIDLTGYSSGMYLIRARLDRGRSNNTNFLTQKIMLIK
ncbi:MAG: T9SS type A sorting domain-containing protein [Gracilimonas sp.]|uniref:T9SS type A sorting domain-containing protein n=1 Tax=Gracilimonas sp. TaxID=1974203 RepID=UPI00375265DF|nr:T9SS type A sorting domain-containing protein [Gracilimonas sp.]